MCGKLPVVPVWGTVVETKGLGNQFTAGSGRGWTKVGWATSEDVKGVPTTQKMGYEMGLKRCTRCGVSAVLRPQGWKTSKKDGALTIQVTSSCLEASRLLKVQIIGAGRRKRGAYSNQLTAGVNFLIPTHLFCKLHSCWNGSSMCSFHLPSSTPLFLAGKIWDGTKKARPVHPSIGTGNGWHDMMFLFVLLFSMLKT